MTITRVLPAAVLAVVVAAGPAAAQLPPYQMPSYQPPGRPPAAAQPPAALPPVDAGPWAGPVYSQPGGPGYRPPTGRMYAQADGPPVAPPPRSPASGLEGLAAPPTADAQPDPLGTLAGPQGPAGLPPGSYASPWFTDGPGCCGPTGRNGLVAYELHTYTGPSLVFGSGAFTDALLGGWMIGGGGRSLFFNPAGDAAWTVDLGLSYSYNRGSQRDFIDTFVRQVPIQVQDPNTGQLVTQARPDRFVTTRLRALHRTSFNYGIGRDLFFWGPGLPGVGDGGWNLRAGADVGGRWGTAHVDLVPQDEGPGAYARRQKIFHGVYLAVHSDLELPVGGWVWTAGWRVEYGYDWMNIAPPLKSDVQSVNLLLTTGFRF